MFYYSLVFNFFLTIQQVIGNDQHKRFERRIRNIISKRSILFLNI